MEENDLFERKIDDLGGLPVFKGTEVPVSALFENLIAGRTILDIAEEFPSVGLERARATLRLASLRIAERFHAR
ncbi:MULTISPECIES: DUF433 domain-containing protein [unclassified Aureimonas]|uniref:DUF433 domain-containing protein n=1 Tax=unclassified Aureimonas TaxID=2615206 RepID=UPI00070F0534|nr:MULTISPECIES: DUF433 domain-containing protein [unclassified Aureimonas]KQT69758.1 hypothetical protein ASG62_01170 [Aureimonas sp. Leaf427]KQT76090.1 hypothetical protein ASG54_15050 [Aureimonas sp. Leaf460]